MRPCASRPDVENLFQRSRALKRAPAPETGTGSGNGHRLRTPDTGSRKPEPGTGHRIPEPVPDPEPVAVPEPEPEPEPVPVPEPEPDWIELTTEPVNEIATQNTGRIIRDLRADVLAVIEAESRPALVHFSRQVLPAVGGEPYERIMLIDGNDERGIDVGVMLRPTCAITAMRSHVDDADEEGLIFSRDCPEYFIETRRGGRLVVLVNHFKSKGYGTNSDARRRRQAHAVRRIYARLRKAGHEHIAVVGDLNDTPDSDALAPLFARTGLRDISEHPAFRDDGRPGTYANGAKGQKIDYVLLSPALFAKVKAGGVERRGVWGGERGTLFPHLPEITRAAEAASDHAAIWAEVGL